MRFFSRKKDAVVPLEDIVSDDTDQVYFLPEFMHLPIAEKLDLLSTSEIEAAMQAPWTLGIDVLEVASGNSASDNVKYTEHVLRERTSVLEMQAALVFERLYTLFTNETIEQSGGAQQTISTRVEKYDFYLDKGLWRRARKKLWKPGDEADIYLTTYWTTPTIPEPNQPLSLSGYVFPATFTTPFSRMHPSGKPAFMVHRIKSWGDRAEKAARYQLTRLKEYQQEHGETELPKNMDVRRSLFTQSLVTDLIAGSFIYLGKHEHGANDSMRSVFTTLRNNSFFQHFYAIGETQNSYSSPSVIPRYQITLHPTGAVPPEAAARGTTKMDQSAIELVISDAESLICGHLFGPNSDPLYKRRRIRSKRTFRGYDISFTDEEEELLEHLRTTR
jgi:hypothetical protein